jgi:hypothetical protein
VELDVYADDQKIIDHQDFHLKVEDFRELAFSIRYVEYYSF